MKEITATHIREIINILLLVALSFILWALFLRIETMGENFKTQNENLKKEIPNQVHALVENTIRVTMQQEFDKQEQKWNVFCKDC